MVCVEKGGGLKECHPRCIYQNYSRSKIREVAVKKHNYICRYNNLPTTCFGHDRPSSGWDTSEEKYFSSDVSQPEDGLSRPKLVVGRLLYL